MTVPRPTNPRSPLTRSSLTRDLSALGVREGDTLLLHSSLRSLGWVCGGAPTVVHALTDVLGARGTVTVPTQTMDNSDPATWTHPPVPEDWWPVIRAESPPFDARVTPTLAMGRIAETLRTWPGAVRSTHPQTSFAALGPQAGRLMSEHAQDCRLGERSPLAGLERAGARVLLLGTGYASCTAFHLAEYRLPRPAQEEFSCAVMTTEGRRAWVTHDDVALDASDFEHLGTAFEGTGAVTTGRVGQATARLFSLPRAVEFATGWLPRHR
ncbi:AAC(3) family N-acetyltransferase [Nocardiopsis sp. EMB25]|uniref:aminoglycoside N(3)-acetyltransferase n=1 Tax=Nocardiopsis sp. EMB25 TaxID=2835867 RepID=UPI0022846693|nr:AAC(3) family N-acetyltransferase [Nocardiopsis sp. EMB25]MCY9784679.1 AAC(3) family N-acetyltransferase [Nocardiopsis sp. EMB25]